MTDLRPGDRVEWKTGHGYRTTGILVYIEGETAYVSQENVPKVYDRRIPISLRKLKKKKERN